MQVQISWLLKKPTDLDLHCLHKQSIARFSRTRCKSNTYSYFFFFLDKMNLTFVMLNKLINADLDLHCLHKQRISGFSKTRVNLLYEAADET